MTTDKNVAVLDAMLELFGPNGEHWGAGEYAHDEYGLPLYYFPPKEHEIKIGDMCLLGAAAFAERVVYDEYGDIATMAENLDRQRPAFYTALLDAVGGQDCIDIADFNDRDGREFSEIRQVIEDAKARLLSNEGAL